MTPPPKPKGSRMRIVLVCDSCSHQTLLYRGWLSKMPGGTWLLGKIADAEQHECK